MCATCITAEEGLASKLTLHVHLRKVKEGVDTNRGLIATRRAEDKQPDGVAILVKMGSGDS